MRGSRHFAFGAVFLGLGWNRFFAHAQRRRSAIESS